MRKKRKLKKKFEKTRSDKFLEKILHYRVTYVILLVLVVVFYFGDDRVLNLPAYIFWVRVFGGFFCIVAFLCWRYTIYKEYYKRKLYDKVYLVFAILAIAVFSFLLQIVPAIPMNYMIKRYAKENQLESFDCKITNVITTKTDKIHFEFMGERYSRPFNVNGFKRKDLMENYLLHIEVRKSLWGSYWVEGMRLKKK